LDRTIRRIRRRGQAMPSRSPRHLAEHRLPWRLMLVAFGLTFAVFAALVASAALVPSQPPVPSAVQDLPAGTPTPAPPQRRVGGADERDGAPGAAAGRVPDRAVRPGPDHGRAAPGDRAPAHPPHPPPGPPRPPPPPPAAPPTPPPVAPASAAAPTTTTVEPTTTTVEETTTTTALAAPTTTTEAATTPTGLLGT